jgi:undecaprenyl-diphosphatase
MDLKPWLRQNWLARVFRYNHNCTSMFDSLKQFDREILIRINSWHTGFLDELMWQLSKDWPTVVLVLLFVFFYYRKNKLKNTASLVLGILLVVACTDLSTNLIKHNVKRYRPTHNTEIGTQLHIVHGYKGGIYGFYSSHAANNFGIATFLFFIAKNLIGRLRWLFFIYPLLVGYSRIYMGVHYPSDILTGFANGLLFGTLLYFIIKRHFFKIDHV